MPGAVFFPAIGLGLLWHWRHLPLWPRRAVVVLLLAGSGALTIRDYAAYGRQPDVGFLFESAAAELARSAAADADAGAAVFIDRRFTDGWPSVRFLLEDRHYTVFSPEKGLPALEDVSVVYAWPYDTLDFLAAVGAPTRVFVEPGPLARGDLEPEPYSLYTRYAITPGHEASEPLATFGGALALTQVSSNLTAPDILAVTTDWEPAVSGVAQLPTLFIHVLGPEGTLAQYDGPLGRGLWPASLWREGINAGERHELQLSRAYDPASDSVQIGLYWADTGERLPVRDARGNPAGDVLTITPEP
jgi:hypothetical protein